MSARDSYSTWVGWPAFVDEATETPACREHPTDLFFPPVSGQKQVEAAKEVCGGCPLLDPCREWALDQPAHLLYGVWGGTTTNERRDRAARERAAGDQPLQLRRNTHNPKGTA